MILRMFLSDIFFLIKNIFFVLNISEVNVNEMTLKIRISNYNTKIKNQN